MPERRTGSGLHVIERSRTLQPPRQGLVIVGKEEHADRLAAHARGASDQHLEQLMARRAGYNTGELVDSVRGAFRAASRQVVGRNDILSQTFFALLTREHQLLYSRAGTAKSLLAKTVFGQFDEARVFDIQMTKGTPEEALVGAVDIQELKEGRVRHNTRGTIVDARLAFLDEIFDANDVALRSLLGILNERQFRKGDQQEQADMHTALAATNYVRSSDVTEAVVDRFAFRSFVNPDRHPYNMLLIDQAYGRTTGKAQEADKKVPFDYVDYLADIVEGQVPGHEITAAPHILFLKNEIILRYMDKVNGARTQGPDSDKKDFYISPRTIAKTRDVLNASALLHGRDAVNIDDLDALKYMVTTLNMPDEDQGAMFEQAKNEVLGSVGRNTRDLAHVDRIMNANALLEELLVARETGGGVDLKLMDKIKLALGWTSMEELEFPQIVGIVKAINPTNASVAALKDGVVDRMEEEIRKQEAAQGGHAHIF